VGDYGEGHVCLGGALARPCTISFVRTLYACFWYQDFSGVGGKSQW